ncbi:MAG: hypothetical protein QG662_397 [Pseudomonadota bacterium]|nr:hypothetical protein [Pseudomonadota bacterium]
MSFLKTTALIGAVCLAVFFGYKYVTADPPGYCAAQNRYISDAEFIRVSEALLAWGMKEQLRTQTRWALENPGHPPTKSPGYVNSSLESFERWQEDIEANRKRPGFAKVDWRETRTIFRWLFGYQQITVILNVQSGDDRFFYVFDACGNVLEGGPTGISTRNIEILGNNKFDQ